jgi:pimeloyl-ACP methyl ester carboxylesterase
MPLAAVNGIRLSYERMGQGEPVLMIMGTGAAGRVWDMYQTAALRQAGYETITFNNRGIPPSDSPPGMYSMADMLNDVIGLVEALAIGPCRIVGTSMGAMVAQEMALTRPDLVHSTVLMATRARSDVFRRAMSRAERELASSGSRLPPTLAAVNELQQMLSPATLNDDAAVLMWLDLFELTAGQVVGGQAWASSDDDRRAALRQISVPCRVIGFADDRITPPHLGAEVAEAIPGCDYVEFSSCGHLGFLERPDEVNAAIIEFVDKY